jgi:hypothetical protein
MKKTAESPRLVLNRETLRNLNAPVDRTTDDRAFIIRTKFSCYSPISCPVPCA